MSSSSRRAAAAAVRAWLIVTLSLSLAGGATGLSAQQLAPGRFASTATTAPPLAVRMPPLQAPPLLQAPRAPLPHIALATALGGVAGGALGAVAGAAAGSMLGGSNEYFSPAVMLGVLGLAVGYPVGAAIGARTGATVDGARPSLGSLVVVSALSAGAGGVVWNGVGETFGSPNSMSSWYMGAVAGFATHLLVTSLAAHRLPAVPARPVQPAPDPDA